MAKIDHLTGPASTARQVLAAHFLRHRPCIIEIGSGNNPISNYLTHDPEVVYLVDPKLGAASASTATRSSSPKIVHLREKYQASQISPAGPFAVVILGLSLKGLGITADINDHLRGLLSDADTVVVEFAKNHERAVFQYDYICSIRGESPAVEIDLKLHDKDVLHAGFSERKFIVFDHKMLAMSH